MGSRGGIVSEIEQEVTTRVIDFADPRQEWRRLVSELVGTLFLVLVAAGGGMMGAAFDNSIGRVAAVVAPGLVAGDFTAYWVYLVGPLLGAMAAVFFAWVLRGLGGGASGSVAAQGALHTAIAAPDKA